ncbi:riboflavin biosynthesis protein RibF [Omnitrophica bacterium]|nr:riboflavin biosynthesis protein RibF [Candidatus Omnitrophota bacterium]
MRIYTETKAYSPSQNCPLVLIVGNFDGVHRGHQSLLARGIQEAARCQGKAAVLTFSKHPQAVLHPSGGPSLLTRPEHKLFLLSGYGIEDCFMLPFTKEFSELEAEQFVEQILVRQLGVHEVCLGYNAHFGYGRKGDVTLMKALAARFGFRFQETPPFKIAGEVVSSSRVRGLVQGGNLAQVQSCLNRPYGILCNVIRGAGLGKKLGFPTANLDTVGLMIPPAGVYPVRVRVLTISPKLPVKKPLAEIDFQPQAPWLQGVLNYGVRPTVDNVSASAIAEVHLPDFSADLYDQCLEVEFYPRLRAEKRFKNTQELKSQIIQDIKVMNNFFAEKE